MKLFKCIGIGLNGYVIISYGSKWFYKWFKITCCVELFCTLHMDKGELHVVFNYGFVVSHRQLELFCTLHTDKVELHVVFIYGFVV